MGLREPSLESIQFLNNNSNHRSYGHLPVIGNLPKDQSDYQQEEIEDYVDKSRYVMSKDTQLEFGIKDTEVPASMRQNLPPGAKYINFIDQNVSITKMTNDLSVAMFLSKIKYNIDNQICAKERR